MQRQVSEVNVQHIAVKLLNQQLNDAIHTVYLYSQRLHAQQHGGWYYDPL